jgi:hypothetical protein
MFRRMLALTLGISFLLLPVSASAQAQSKNKIIFIKNKKENPKLIKLLNNVEKIFDGVANVRQLKARNQVKVGIKSTTELNSFLQELFKKEYPDKDLKKDYILLERLGLIKKNTNLKETFLNLYTEQIAGFYDDDSQSLYLIENSRFGGIEFSIIISHELVHALQDQNFNLKKVLETDKNSDITLARTALVEGEAMVASMQYQVSAFKFDMNSLKDISGFLKGSLINGEGMDALKNAPGFLVEQMTFPYIDGAKFVQEVYDYGGGWEEFSKIYKKLPNSTEQILHPEKYLENEQPMVVTLDEKFLNDKSWKFLEKDNFGEFSLMNYFLEYLDEDEAKTAAAGWGGDIFALYEKENNESVFVFKTLWDTDKDAVEFYSAYIKSLEERYGADLKIINKTEKKYEVDTPRGKVLILLKNNSVNLTEGFSEPMKENIMTFLEK